MDLLTIAKNIADRVEAESAKQAVPVARTASRRSRAGDDKPLTPVCADLDRYEAPTHFNGQSTVTPDADRVAGESYTITTSSAEAEAARS